MTVNDTNKPLSDGKKRGRDSNGRFTKKNSFGRGNPLGQQVNKLRIALINAVKPEDYEEIAQVLLRQAKSGNVSCIKELLDRTIGKPLEADVLERLDEFERILDEIEATTKPLKHSF